MSSRQFFVPSFSRGVFLTALGKCDFNGDCLWEKSGTFVAVKLHKKLWRILSKKEKFLHVEKFFTSWEMIEKRGLNFFKRYYNMCK